MIHCAICCNLKNFCMILYFLIIFNFLISSIKIMWIFNDLNFWYTIFIFIKCIMLMRFTIEIMCVFKNFKTSNLILMILKIILYLFINMFKSIFWNAFKSMNLIVFVLTSKYWKKSNFVNFDFLNWFRFAYSLMSYWSIIRLIIKIHSFQSTNDFKKIVVLKTNWLKKNILFIKKWFRVKIK